MTAPSATLDDVEKLGLAKENIDNMYKIIQIFSPLLPPELTTTQQFNLAFYYRLLAYLTAACNATHYWLWSPSRDLLRTCFEMVVKGLFFIAYPEEAEKVKRRLEAGDEKAFDYSIKSNLLPKLYEGEKRVAHERFYKAICPYSHADIQGAILNFKDNAKERQDCVSIICALEYASIALLRDSFIALMNPQLEEEMGKVVQRLQKCITMAPDLKPNNMYAQ